MPFRLTRRRFVQLTATGTAAAAAAAAPAGCEVPLQRPVYFTAEARSALAALADYVLPPDARDPGAAALGAVDFIEALLTAFEWPTPRIWLGGPFSGRAPYPRPDGTASDAYPPNDFETVVPLDRVTEAAWRLRLYGSAGLPGGGPNDALFGPARGLREIFRTGLAAAMAATPEPLAGLDRDALRPIWNGLDPDLQAAVIELTLESLVAAPEYGGNRDGGGWNIVHWDGDVQPLGFSVFDYSTSTYVERPDFPMSTSNPGPDADPLSDVSRTWVELVTVSLGGRVLK